MRNWSFLSDRGAWLIVVWLSCLTLLPAATPLRAGDELLCISDRDSCVSCHAANGLVDLPEDPARACHDYCSSCHGSMQRHHPVEVAVPGHLSKQLKLTSKNGLTCTTCHDVTGNRTDSVSWECESWFRRLFRRASTYRTFYLITRNNKGQLCRNCH